MYGRFLIVIISLFLLALSSFYFDVASAIQPLSADTALETIEFQTK